MIRTRLALWNALALALVLVLLGAFLFAATRASLYGAVDDDLGARARFMQDHWANVGPHVHRGRDHGHDRGRSWEERGERPESSGIDPELSRRVAFDAFIARPRVVRLDEAGASGEEPPWDARAMARALRGRREAVDAVVEGHRARVLSFPILVDGKVVAGGQFAAPLDAADAATARLAGAMLLLLPVALGVTSVVGVALTRRALRPVAEFAASAGRIEASRLTERLPEHGRDEFSELARVFNAMLDRVEGSFRQLEGTLRAQRRFVADASHELKTPLGAIKTRLGVALRKDQTPARYVEHLRAIRTASDAMTAVVGDLLLLARADEGEALGERRPVPLASLADEAASMVAEAHGRPIEVRVEDGLTVLGDEAALFRVLVNLLDNAARHTPQGGTVEIRGHREGERTVLRVRDTGVGIPPEDVPRVFDRFYRVAAARDRESGGTGLGLAIVRSIVVSHGGEVSIESELGKGTAVTVELPARSPSHRP